MFHKLTRERDAAVRKDNETEVTRCDELLKEMGGREEYQRASQLSTSFHSTSKWVLGQLANTGWLFGIVRTDHDNDNSDGASKNSKAPRRPTRLLEVGAINTELLDAAEETKEEHQHEHVDQQGPTQKMKYRLDVRAIDIHSMDKRVEEMDFLELPYTDADPHKRYDVIVCSMVINCVTTPKDRGKMLMRLYHHLRPGGLCFLTLPLFCLTKSAFLTHKVFKNMLEKGGVGFEVVDTKKSPRLAFFICRRPEIIEETASVRPVWTKQVIRHKGKKFPNQFSVVLDDAERRGEAES
jgi:25S rRNA (adenine2142-N1)-methyltransferase